jgi:hypothetical protein
MSGTIWVWQGGDGLFRADVEELPGCVASGVTRDDAVAKVRATFRDYQELLEKRGVSTEHWRDLDPATFVVNDVPTTPWVHPEDERPLQEHELRDFLHQVEASRSALLGLVRGFSPDELERKPSATTWSVREALEHIMTTEVALLSRLERWPGNEFATLQAVHRMMFQRFTVMEPEDFVDHTIQGRRWTTRRVMRRILEHEYEHLNHIKEIAAELGSDRPPE